MSDDDPFVARAHAIAEERFVTASGPGGQNVNKVATAVQLRVNVYCLNLPPRVFQRLKKLAGSRLTAGGELLIDARRHRRQDANRADARQRLNELLSEALIEPKRRGRVRVNRVGKRARLQQKKQRGAVKARRGRPQDWD